MAKQNARVAVMPKTDMGGQGAETSPPDIAPEEGGSAHGMLSPGMQAEALQPQAPAPPPAPPMNEGMSSRGMSSFGHDVQARDSRGLHVLVKPSGVVPADRPALPADGLSRIFATELYPASLDGFASGASWLDGGRPDYVNATDPTDRNYVSIGCATLFLNWLRYQLHFTWAEIVAAGAPTLAGTYQ